MNLTEWARAQGVHPQTAYRWFREGTLPVPAVRVNQRTVLVSPDAPTEPAAAYGLYARVSSHDQREDLDRQVARLTTWAADAGGQVVRVGAEAGYFDGYVHRIATAEERASVHRAAALARAAFLNAPGEPES